MSDASNFPDSLLRGVRSKKHLAEKGVSLQAFKPNPSTINKRLNAGLSADAETSVCWEFDPGAEEVLRSDRDATAFGVARLDDVGTVTSLKKLQGVLSREKREVPENKYHGNLLFAATAKDRWNRVAALLASLAELLPAPKDEVAPTDS